MTLSTFGGPHGRIASPRDTTKRPAQKRSVTLDPRQLGAKKDRLRVHSHAESGTAATKLPLFFVCSYRLVTTPARKFVAKAAEICCGAMRCGRKAALLLPDARPVRLWLVTGGGGATKNDGARAWREG
jgi:hypothetical protein